MYTRTCLVQCTPRGGSIKELGHINLCPMIVVIWKEAQDPNIVTHYYDHFDVEKLSQQSVWTHGENGCRKKYQLHTQHNG